MKVLILGSSGYIGNALMTFLEKKKYEVVGIDNNSRALHVQEVGSQSLTPVTIHPKSYQMDVINYEALKRLLEDTKPDVVVHLAEQPSAPFSMIDASHATVTQANNILGSLNVLWAIKEVNPKIHLIKLGTAGEYPDYIYDKVKIPEGKSIRVNYLGKDWTIPVPRGAGSFYHYSKLFDSHNCEFANRIWGLNITDINQAPVWGHIDGTRFDYDQYFGTVVNRFAVQKAIGMPLTIYGTGEQQRGFIHLQNALEAIELAIKNPAQGYRIIHQLTEVLSINEVAELVGGEVKRIPNPRKEMPKNKFTFEMKQLKDWGLKPIYMKDKIGELLKTVEKHKDNIIKDVIYPTTKWNE